MTRYLAAVSAICATTLLTTGCMRDNVLDLSSPPTLPPLATISIPELGKAGLSKQVSVEKSAGLAYAAAVTSVSFWTNLTAVTLAAPVSLFAIVHSTEPIALPDGEGWIWQVGKEPYSAVLTATGGDGVVEWTMTVSWPEMKDFVWFTGTSNINGTVGDWSFNGLDNGLSKYRFSYTVTGSTLDAKASVVGSNDPAAGNYLEWKIDQTTASFVAHSAPEKETVTIVWDRTTGAGKMTSLRSGNSHCWGAWNLGYPDIYCDGLSF